MKMVTIIVKADKIKKVEKALREINAPGFTYFEAKGHGREIEVSAAGGRAAPLIMDIIPRGVFFVVCQDEMVDKIVEAVRNNVAAKGHGEGIIFVAPVERVVRTSTGEEGEAALR